MTRKQIGTMWGCPVIEDSTMNPGEVWFEGIDRHGKPVRIKAENVGAYCDAEELAMSTPNNQES